jgi:lipoprotein Spr
MAMVGCTTTKPVTTTHGNSSGTTKSSDSPLFLDNITANGPTASGRTSSEKEKQEFKTFRPPLDDFHPRFTIESGTTIQFKYAIVMDVEVERLDNQDLYRFIDSWWGTPYRMGGTTQKGVDCSAFVKTLESVIYGTNLPRTAREQKSGCSIITGSDLKEGDLVFFNTRGGVSHVGVYLTNNKFVHASTSGGVTISDLYDSYWHSRFLGAGRYKNGTAMK